MLTHRAPNKPIYYEPFPLLDGEFDRFDLDDELNFILREAETATLFHRPLRLQD
ncbi:MAG: hypothetical protein ACOY3V_03095 [Pseudomonadota bacterium]